MTGSSTRGPDEGELDAGDGAGGPPPEFDPFVPRFERVTQQAGLDLPHFTMDPFTCLLEDV